MRWCCEQDRQVELRHDQQQLPAVTVAVTGRIALVERSYLDEVPGMAFVGLEKAIDNRQRSQPIELPLDVRIEWNNDLERRAFASELIDQLQ